jgi:pyruvate kinase
MNQPGQQNVFNGTTSSQRRAKIVCTIGPASNSEEMIRQLTLRGMDVARLNFSHGTHEDHSRVIHSLRAIAAELGRTICILQDLQGPKIRIGRLKDRVPVVLETGHTVTIRADDAVGTPEVISTTYAGLPNDVKPGERILLADGRIELLVKTTRGKDVICEVLNGGILGEHQGINLPGTAISIPAVTEKDEADLDFGLRNGVDAIAISFVRTAQDVTQAQQAILQRGYSVPVIAKLEKPQAIDNLDSILEVANGVMIARGDLGVELPPEKVPLIQKQVIRRAFDFRRPVITATQMLESMIENPRPTRAEASDVANAILDGTDAVMLSGETAAGKYPREALEMMSRIVVEAESDPFPLPRRDLHEAQRLTIADTICESMGHAVQDLNIRAIAVYTETATSARTLSKFRPGARIYAFTSSEAVCNRMNLLWGVAPLRCPPQLSAEQMATFAEAELTRVHALSAGDVFGLIAGTTQTTGSTNFLRLITAGESAESRS